MNEHVERLKQDLQTIEGALGLDTWTRRDVRRGLLGDLAGGAAGLFLALWNLNRGEPAAGLIAFLVVLLAVIVLKDLGYRRNPAPAAGSRREIAFYNRYFLVGSLVIGCYYFWGQRAGMEPPTVFASTVVMLGLWYIFYAISAPSRAISLAGAVPLTLCGFLLPDANGLSQMLAWLGVAACLGCWLESALLLIALREKGGAASASPGNAANPPPAPAASPVPGQPETPLTGHAAY